MKIVKQNKEITRIFCEKRRNEQFAFDIINTSRNNYGIYLRGIKKNNLWYHFTSRAIKKYKSQKACINYLHKGFTNMPKNKQFEILQAAGYKQNGEGIKRKILPSEKVREIRRNRPNIKPISTPMGGQPGYKKSR